MISSILIFFSKAFKAGDIRKKILITALILVFYRLISHIPAAGIDVSALASLFKSSPILTLLDVFSGGTLANFSILALGLNPYINASIILQLMTYVVPSLEELSKEGEYGHEKINQYSRLLTIPLAAFQAFAMYSLLVNQGVLPQRLAPVGLVALVLTMTAGSMIAVWMGELITQYGLGNGVSFLIFAGIISRLPVTLTQTVTSIGGEDILKIITYLILAALVIFMIVFMNEATRKIPIMYGRVRSKTGPVSSYIPLRLNQAGVIPIIFAVSLVLLPSFIAQFVSGVGNPTISRIASDVTRLLNPQSVVYNVLYFVLVFGFTYFYTAVVFNPEKIAESLQKNGGFVPGIRPGSQTVKYLGMVLGRITLVGAFFLGTVAILPSFFQKFIGVANLAVGGTGILIVVSVVLEIVRDLESQLVMKKYDTFVR